MYCKNCGLVLNAGDNVCTNCGTPVGQGANYCGDCGTQASADSNVCIACGKPIHTVVLEKNEQPVVNTEPDPNQNQYQDPNQYQAPSPYQNPDPNQNQYQNPNMNQYQNPNMNQYQNPNMNQFQNQGVPGGYVQKSKIAAGLLGIFLGEFGIHNFYLGYTTKAIVQLSLTILGWILTCIVIGGFLVAGMAIWGLVEGIFILTGKINVDGHGVPLTD